MPGPGHRAAEQVIEHHQEEHRRDDRVRETFRGAPDPDQAAARQRQAVPDHPEQPGACHPGILPPASRGGRRGRHAASSAVATPPPAAPGSRPVVDSSRKTTAGSRSGSRPGPGAAASLPNRSRPVAPRHRPARTGPAARPPAPWQRPRRRSSNCPISTRFSVPVRSSSTDAYWPVKPIIRRTRRASRTTSSPPTSAGPQLGGKHPHRRGLPPPVRPKQPQHRTGHGGRVNPSQRDRLPESPDQALRLERVAHDHDTGRARSQNAHAPRMRLRRR